jgi:hypothetical protein
VYFTTDTHKIYCGSYGQYIPMGGSTGLYYGTRQLAADEIHSDQTIFYFTQDQIEGSSLPVVNDLILNIPDGGFYKITDIDSNRIET